MTVTKMDEAERLLGPAYWDDGDPRSIETVVARMMARPDRHFSPLATLPHHIFGPWPEIPGQRVGALHLGGALHNSVWPISATTIRSYQVLRPLTLDHLDQGARWQIGALVQHAHDERSLVDGKHARRVDAVSARITIAVQLLRWDDRWWWLLIRDDAGLTVLQRATGGGAWRRRPDVLAAIDMLTMRLPGLDEIEL